RTTWLAVVIPYRFAVAWSAAINGVFLIAHVFNTRDQDPSVIVFPDQNLKREVEGEAGSRQHEWRGGTRGPKISSLVGGIFIPTFWPLRCSRPRQTATRPSPPESP